MFALGLKIEGERTETLHLRGLDPEATYSIKEINCGERLHLARRVEDTALQSATGRDLMERGLAVMLSGDYDSAGKIWGHVRRAKLGWTSRMVRQVKRDSNLRNERSSH